MSARINEIKLDLDDLETLLKVANRQKSKDTLGLEIRRLQTELSNLQNKIAENQENETVKSVSNASKCYDIKLTNYAWDQSNQFIKIYITLNKVQTISKESISCNFSERSMDLRVTGLENKNYTLSINNLCENIDKSKSYFKIKTDMVIVYLAKQIMKDWSCVTSVEKVLQESKSSAPNISDNEDPSTTLMNLMKKMYQDGDSEMKKTIAKAWVESQEKKANYGLGGLGDF